MPFVFNERKTMNTFTSCCLYTLLTLSSWSGVASAQIVEMPDPNLKQAVRETLALSNEIPLTQPEMLRLKTLDARDRQIADLTGLEYATNLIRITLPDNEISDLTPLARLMRLEYLWFWGNPISDLFPLMNLTALKRIDLAGGQISDISPLANLTQLTSINLRYNHIEDISALTNLNQLTELRLNSNRIVDVSPLANLTLLERLEIHNNSIVDIQPLANLENLMDLKIADNPIRDFSPLLGLNLKNVDIDIHMLQELVSVEVEIPDPNLERAIREELALADEIPLTQADMLQLNRLEARNSQIKHLTGLEYATNLIRIILPDNEISDLTPLARLMRLEYLWFWGNPISDLLPLMNLTALKRIDLARGQISDISPLANLTQLTSINLRYNHIEDISALTNLNQLTELRLNSNRIVDVSPLANLTLLEHLEIRNNSIVDIQPLANLDQLTELRLNSNRIVDVSPLANLTLLERLEIHNNSITDHSPLEALSLTHFTYDEICELPRVPIQNRINNRSFPSIFTPWAGIGWSSVLNRPDLSDAEHLALHDVYWSPLFGLRWRETEQGMRLMGELDKARQQRDALAALNPNMLFIVEIRMRDAFVNDFYPEDWPYWIRDENGNLRPGIRGQNYYLIDFTHPELQEQIVEQAIAVARCGLFDGIFFDWWREDGDVLTNYQVGWTELLPGGNEAEQRARDSILQRIRAAVTPDFLIIGNGNRRKFPRTAPYINGTFMETLRDYDDGYTHGGLAEIESTLFWAEENLREPQINCLEGWAVVTESLDSPRNRRWMRVFTTMSLTLSDGYVMYNTGDSHDHYWYDFWDADLGKPIGAKAELYQNAPGLFIREFTNGWAVYNRSGTAQEISLTEEAMGVSSGQTGRTHQLADLDGEIYLKTVAGQPTSPYDLNKDGVVNVLDLILTAQNLGSTEGDINGDGITSILDLILVAQHLGETSTPAAPAALHVSLSPETVQKWIDMAYAQNDGSVIFAQGIAMLERLLALMIPDKTVLRANYPNPFNPETWIPYHLASETEVRISIYDLRGVLVRQFNLGHQKAGYYTDRRKAVYWDGRNEIGEPVSSGIYFYTLTTDDYTGTRRMVILK